MKTFVVLILAAALALPVTAAWAGGAEGKITKWESTTRTITLEDGTQFWITDTVKTETIKEGDNVKVTYEDRDGKKYVTTYEVIQK